MEPIEGLMRALLPGGAGFPAADARAASVLADRLRAAGVAVPAAAPGEDWTLAAARFERESPRAFAAFRTHAYLTYYEQPGVVTAIRALGHPYNDSPLPDGYPDEAFVAERDAPRQPRGRWIEPPE